MEISNEVRAVEVHQKATSYYQASEQFGYKFLMEVKIIRDEKLFKDLGYEDFEQYTQLNFNYSRNTMNERILSAEAFGEEYNRALGSYGKHKTRQLAQMPEKERQQALEEGIPTDEGIKPIEEATTREIDRYQKQLKAQEEHFQAQLKQKDELIESMADSMHDFELHAKELADENEQLKNKPAEVVEKPVVPEDYSHLKESNAKLSRELEKAEYEARTVREAYDTLLKKRQEEDEGSKKYKELTEAIKDMEGQMTRQQKRIQSQKQVYELVDQSKDLLQAIAPIPYLINAEFVNENPVAKRELENIATQTEKFLEHLNNTLRKPVIIEGEFIND